MKKHQLFTCAGIFIITGFSHAVQAQSVIRGLVSDNKGVALQYATVLLLNSSDSSLEKARITDKQGAFIFENIADGNYFIASSSTGFKQLYTPSFVTDSNQKTIELGSIQLIADGIQLDEVILKAKPPLLEQRIDRLVINVKNSITAAGNTALDILERSPGVIVNRQNNSFAMMGKEGVVIMINGKINYMPLSAVLQMLAGMNAGNIEKIELITTPPASFDAGGNAGFINIILVESSDFGTNGSYTITGGYRQGAITAASISINHRKSKLNVYGDYSFNRVGFGQSFFNYRRIGARGTETETYTYNDRALVQGFNNARLGLDYQVSKKTVIGTLLGGTHNRYVINAYNDITIFSNRHLDTVIKMRSDEINESRHIMANVNLQHTCTEGEVLSFDLDYLHYYLNNPNNYHNHYNERSGHLLHEEKIRIGKTTPIHMYVAKADYTGKAFKNVDFETGVKLSLSRLNNDVKVEKLEILQWITDGAFSANYDLKEDIAAAYALMNVTLNEKTNIKSGLRYEYTTTYLSSGKDKSMIDRRYGNLFPSIFLSRRVNEQHSLDLSYSQRITRPAYNDIAPFVIFADPKIFFTGNPALRPSITNTIKGGYKFKNYLFSLSFSHERNPIAQFQTKVNAATNTQVITTENLINRKTLAAILSIPLTVTKWWNIQHNITGVQQQVNAIYNDKPAQLNQINCRITSSHNFILLADFSLELSGFYQSTSLFGTAVLRPMGSFNAGIQKKFNKAKLGFNINDAFNTLRYKTSLIIAEQNVETRTNYIMKQRSFRLTYAHHFGNKSLKANRTRATGSVEERGRVQ